MTSKSGCEHDIIVDFDAHVEDYGIGSYEFWGAKGFHHDYQPEIDRETVVVSLMNRKKEREINLDKLCEENALAIENAIVSIENEISIDDIRDSYDPT